MKKVKLLIIILLTILSPLNSWSQILFGWVNQIGASNGDEGMCITTDDSNNVYVCGRFVNTVDFDPGPGIFNMTSAGSGDVFICKYYPDGNLIWAKRIGGSTDVDYAESIFVDLSGSIHIAGTFSGNVDFDPGPGTSIMSSAGNGDVFVLKLSSLGNYIWAKKWGGIGFDYGRSIQVDNTGNVFVAGGFSYTVDFNPGAPTFNLTSAGNLDIFISKLDASGNFVWAKRMGGTNPDEALSLVLDNTNNVYTTGYFYNTVDFDPGGGIYNMTSAGSQDVFINKLDPNGNFLQAHRIGGISLDKGLFITVNQNSDIIVTGNFLDTVDLNPNLATNNFYAPYTNGFVVKLSSSGIFIWAQQITGTEIIEAPCVKTDDNSNLYIGGHFRQTIDLDPGPGSLNSTSLGNYDIFLIKLTSAGNFIWGKHLGGTDADYVYELVLDADDNVISTGSFNDSVDFNPGSGTEIKVSQGALDGFVLKLKPVDCSNLTIAIDSLYHASCSDSGFIFLHATNGLAPYQYAWNTIPPLLDSSLFYEDEGVYSITVTDSNECVKSSSLILFSPDTASGFDLHVNLVAGSFIPNNTATLWLDGFNESCIPVTGQLILVIDSFFNFVNSSPIPDNISGDSLFWNFSNLTYDSAHITPVVNVAVPPILSAGDSLFVDLIIEPLTGDIDTTNNIRNYTFLVGNSYVANNKANYPAGECPAGYLLPNQPITYAIHFQNVGTTTANNIHIIDTLDSNLNLNSLEIAGSSHPVVTHVITGNVLKFNFDNIMLPDSNSNEVGSHGYVIFEILPNDSILNNSSIENKVYITFDSIPAIITNVVHNTIVNTIPNSSSSLAQSACDTTVINGNTYTNSGVFVHYMDNYLGCDSVITLNLTIYNSTSSNLSASTCDSFVINGFSYTNSGNYLQTLINSVGCDSILSLDLIILDSTINTITTSSCYSYTLNSNSYNSSGTYYQTLTNSVGCDSVIVLNLSILDSSFHQITTTSCDSLILNGNTYSSSGIYYQNLTNSVGCDSIITLNLTINNADTAISQSGFTLTANEFPATYQWIDCNNSNLPISGETNQSFTATANGNYAVIVTANGCTDTSACQTIFGFGLDDQNFLDGLMVSPNPTNSILNISSIIELKNAVLVITDINGQILLEKNQVSGKNIQLDLNRLNAGMYFLQIFSSDKNSTVKIVKN